VVSTLCHSEIVKNPDPDPARQPQKHFLQNKPDFAEREVN
jgi:hypothetical protein